MEIFPALTVREGPELQNVRQKAHDFNCGRVNSEAFGNSLVFTVGSLGFCEALGFVV